MSEWKTAGNAGDSWKPENKGDTVQGIYKAKKENVGINSSNVYMLQVKGVDDLVSVWGSTVLDTKFEEIETGSEVRIEYLGDVKGKGPKPYKDFKVDYRDAEDIQETVAKIFPEN